MTENSNNNQGSEKKPDKNIKPRFNTNWIFAILAVSVILFQVFYGGKAVQKTTTSEIKEMIANRDIEKIIVVNKDQAEIYLKKEALESGRYPKLPKPGTGFGMSVPKPNFTYNIGDISSFEPFILEAQKSAGYTEKELIYPDYQTRKNYLGRYSFMASVSCIIACFMVVPDETDVRWRSRRCWWYFQCW